MNTMTKTIFAAFALAAVGSARAGEVLTGDAAVAKFPASLQKMGLTTAKWMQLTNGVEYYYGYFTNLLGTIDGYTKSKNAVHLLRIDYANAPVMMKLVDHTQESPNKWKTSETAARGNALFAINLMMEYKDSSFHPHGYAKARGTVIPNGMTLSNTGVKGGYAFNDDKTYAFSTDWTATNPATGKIYADDWDNVFTKEAVTMSNGKVTWGSGASYFGRANYPFFGTTADGVIWVGTVDGRNSSSDGLGYHEVAALQKELGCIDGVCCDGGGSTTMAIRKDLMTASDICPTQKLSSDADNNYYTMNYLSDGSERKVINQLLFVVPFKLGDAAARPQTDYNGNVVTVAFAGEIPPDAEATATLKLEDPDYTGVGTVDAERHVVTFELDDAAVTAGNTYVGEIRLVLGADVYTKSVRLVQGTLKLVETSDWIRETAGSFASTGAWSGDRAEVSEGVISVSNATFTASESAPQDAVVTIASELSFKNVTGDRIDPLSRAALTVVKAGGVNRYAFQTADGVVTNFDVVATLGGVSCVTVTLDNAEHLVSYAVGGNTFGPFPAGTGAEGGVEKVVYAGVTDVASLNGSYTVESVDANLAKSGGAEFPTVAEALAAGSPVELLWDASWNPSVEGEYSVATNGHRLVIGGAMAYSVRDNGDGTLTVTVSGADPEAAEPSSITLAGSTVTIGVADPKDGLWYAVEKTTDIKTPFVVDDTTWVSGASLISGQTGIVVTLGSGEKQAFYRIVTSAVAPIR